MANIDTITGLERKIRRHFKKVFARLNEEFFIREPLLDHIKVAPIVVEGPVYSWVFIGWHARRPTLSELDKVISFNNKLESKMASNIKYLAVVEELDESIPDGDNWPTYIELITQKEFYEFGENLIVKYLTEFTVDNHAKIKTELFPESVIPAQCTTRRKNELIDNSAILQPFFLDYDQELATRFDMVESVDIAEEQQEDFSVRLINGVAGSGKTLILINRAIIFCKKYPHKQVLLVIHNLPVTADIRHRFETWLGGIPKNLKISTFHAFALSQKSCLSGRVKPLFSGREFESKKKAILNTDNKNYAELSLTDEQIWSELEYINDYLIKNGSEYLEFDRQGRGFALQKSQRERIWQLYQQVVKNLSDVKGYLPSLYIREIALLRDSNEACQLIKYDHIMVDEAQFFAPSWLQVVKNSLSPNGSIFLCADPNQGFLKSRLSWKSVGFNIRGRTKRLSYSYRTTYEIMIAANALLEGLDDSPEDFVKPDLEKMERGCKPYVIYSHTHQDEQRRFLSELVSFVKLQKIPFHQIMVLCSDLYKTQDIKRDIEEKLGHGTVVNYNNRNELATGLGDKIRVMSINSCTGMESGVTFVLGVGGLINKPKNLNLTESEKDVVKQESLRKLYVSMTRAGQKLVVFSTEKLPDSVKNYVNFSGISLD
ncbi:UvrD-helicase domain-containing protein [Xenorhabdus sp. KK7.4]|uniref:UvrD-helicase domain-containing protein n=1 Tax=Xenorhabdus sp. KK7.4 TaxID=1851572 RepID=UPI000C04064F|nr:UvrD-helicase domain-containing protein [Xenorhabdus sp. KK7.4]PHM59266.1 DNA helicase II [Xenorhabdus sp. KK7.4]